jgi:hypothetical protein
MIVNVILTNFAYALQAPFIPSICIKKGMSSSHVGYLFGTMAGAQICAALIYARVFSYFEVQRSSIMRVCSVLMIIQQVGIGVVSLEASLSMFVPAILTFYIIGGVGQGFLTATVIAALSGFNKNEREKYTGQTFAMGGVGLIFSPLYGALAFQFVSPPMIFIVAGVIYFLVLILIWPSFKFMDRTLEDFSYTQGQSHQFNGLNQVPALVLLQQPRLLFAGMSQMNILGALMFI